MSKDPDETRRVTPPPPDVRKVPPPPDIRKGPPAAPTPSILIKPAGEKPSVPPLKVSIAEDRPEGAADPEPREAEASLQDRVIATVIDLVICAGIMVSVSFLPSFAAPESLGKLLAAAYFVTRDSLPFLGGQSVGKKAMRIRAVTSGGESLAGNWKAGLIRNAVLLIPFFIIIELYVLITRQDQPTPAIRLGDEWAGTKVINAPATQGGDDSPEPES